MELPQRIKEWRERKGLTQEQAATRIGVTLGTFCRWEKGKRSPTGLAKAAMARELEDKQ